MEMTECQPPPASPPDEADQLDEARRAVWRLFQEGYIDEDVATAWLLQVDLSSRRGQRNDPGTSSTVRGTSASTPD
jgi:hypothetical protein